MAADKIKRVCVLMPPNLIPDWLDTAKDLYRSYKNVLKGRVVKIIEYSSDVQREKRDRTLRDTRKEGNPFLVIASNALLVSSKEPSIKNPLFPTGKDSGQYWDWVVIDEVSLIEGPLLLSKFSKL